MKKLDPKLIKLKKEQRLHQLEVPVIGLTGGIATGKSSVSSLMINAGVPLIDADKLVKDIYTLSETLNFIKQNWPECLRSGGINFPALREIFFKDTESKKKIEDFIYQRIPAAFKLAYEKLGRPSYIVYDVPLMFEKGLDTRVDIKVLVYAPREIQKERLMARDGNSESMAETILMQQINIEEKKQRSDFIIRNDGPMTRLAEEVERFLRQVLID